MASHTGRPSKRTLGPFALLDCGIAVISHVLPVSLEGRSIDSDPLIDKVGIFFSPRFSFWSKISLALG